tara:strand:- start:241567 stop:242436 length:870 start_codon:yes stop_codon:yes gene_type:complete
MPVSRTHHIIQITDTHLFRNPEALLLGLNSQDSFERIISQITADPLTPELIIATGDIAQDASTEAYQRFADTLDTLEVPYYWIPGNHDRVDIMQAVENARQALTQQAQTQQAQNGQKTNRLETNRQIRLGNWQLIMLDTSVPGEVHGFLAEQELAHLQQCLQQAEQDAALEHSLVCLHHNPVDGTAGWMEDIGLHNAQQFRELIARYSSVRAVVYGHIHQELDFVRDGIRYICTPSTCIQFKPGVEEFTLDLQAPAYRKFELQHDGQLTSSVQRLTDYEVNVDETAEGY